MKDSRHAADITDELLDILYKKTPNYETIEDTLIDLANYAIIGLMVQRGQWAGIDSGKG